MLPIRHARRTLRHRAARGLFATLVLSLMLGVLPLSFAAAAGSYTVVTPTNPDGWQASNVRSDATVGITTAQPRGDAPNNLGSLAFTTNTVTNGQDKADYVKYWGVVPGRTLGNLSALRYDFYRASSSTTAQHFVPAFRLAYSTNETPAKTGYLIWENVYNGGSTATPVPTDQWIANDILNGYFWMRAFGPGRTIEKYDVTLAQWASGYTYGTSQPLDANTNIVGIEVGVGSGWGGAFTGYVDQVATSFGSDSVTANFEPNPVVVQCTTDCYVDDDTGNNANGGTSFADAKQTIQAGINQVSSGGTVHVKDGTYTEDLLISKPLTLEGVQHSVLAKGRPGAQAIVKATNSANPVDIQADNVTIDGFVFDGSAATSRPWIITALSGPGNGRYENMHILNNEFKGNPGAFPGGMYLFNHDDPTIEGNYFNALGQHAVFLAGNSTNAIYRNNDSYRNYNSNISTQDNTASGHQNILIENNRAVEDDMILFNMRDATVRNNTITGGSYSPSRIWLGGGNNNVLITGNSFSSLRSTAVQVLTGFAYSSNSTITVTNNTINTTVAFQNDNYSMIDFRDGTGTNLVDSNKVTLSGSYAAGGSATHAVGVRGSTIGMITITNNEFDGGNVSNTGTPPSSAVLIRSNSASGALPASAVITVANNYLKNFSNGLTVYDFVANSYGGLASGVTLAVNKNSITGNGTNGVITGANDPALNAENNWWGSNTGPTAAGNPGGTGDKATGNVDYDPWLCSGTDTSTATGFQPNPQTSPCTPPTGTLTVTKYNDLNGNGARDTGELGLSGWTITVSQNNAQIASGTTDGNGSLTFANVAPGSYTVCETLQSGWTNTDPSNGSGCKTATVTANSTTTVLLGNKVVPSGPAPAQPNTTYAIDNNPDKDTSQLYTLDITTGAATPRGPRIAKDVEDVKIDPSTKAIYASTGSDVATDRGVIYRVDGVSGVFTPVGPSGFMRITALAFRLEGNVSTLWGWAEGTGLVRLNPATGAGTLVFKDSRKIEGMAWNPDGSKLYLAIDTKLYQYTPANNKLVSYAGNLPKGTESLDIMADGNLAGGARKKNVLTLFTYNPNTKQVLTTRTVTPASGSGITSIEGLAYQRPTPQVPS